MQALVSAFGESLSLSTIDARYRCDVDGASLPANPAWPDDYVATRTEGCGVVTYELPFGPSWSRFIAYSTSSGEAIGASSVDAIPATLETSTCSDLTVSVGSYPAASCASEVMFH